MYYTINSTNGKINLAISFISSIFHTAVLIFLCLLIKKCLKYKKIIEGHKKYANDNSSTKVIDK